MEHEEYMRQALELARQAMAEGEVPVGCVIVRDGAVVGRGRNRRETAQTALGHAELEAIGEACRTLGGWRLWQCTLYVTLEPCIMCAGLMHQSRIARCVFGAPDPKAGAVGTLYQVNADERLNHTFEVTPGVLADECSALLKDFFANKRKK